MTGQASDLHLYTLVNNELGAYTPPGTVIALISDLTGPDFILGAELLPADSTPTPTFTGGTGFHGTATVRMQWDQNS